MTPSRALLIAKRRHLRKENAQYSHAFQEIPKEQWPEANVDCIRGSLDKPNRIKVFRNQDFLVQVFSGTYFTPAVPLRLSIIRTALQDDGQFRQDISWEDLMASKRGCGYGDQDAVEVFPADSRIVNVANMRHLWIMGTMPWIWKAGL